VHNTIVRFAKYTSVGFSTFILDLFLLFLLIDILDFQYLIAAAAAYLFAVSANYLISRRYVFVQTKRSFTHGYAGSLAIAGAGMVLVVVLMALCVELFGLSHLIARVFVAAIVGFWNYLMNLYVNFKVAGNH